MDMTAPGLMLPVFVLSLLSMGLAEGQVQSAVLEGKLTLSAVGQVGKGISVVPR